jgi:hypothetical protein
LNRADSFPSLFRFQSSKDPCRVCKQEVSVLFQALVRNKYQVVFGQCSGCGLIQTEEPYWLAEAYDQAISDQDVGLVRRNLRMSEVVQGLVLEHFNPRKRFLDYAGGYGLLVRLLRDAGLNFLHHDPHAPNIFAKLFSLPSFEDAGQFELITACELFEHLLDPVEELQKLFKHTDSVFIATELLPYPRPQGIEDWWYFAPESGQHVTFYSLEALHVLARETGASLYSDSRSLHLLTRRRLASVPFRNPKTVLGRLDRMLGRWRSSLRKRMYRGTLPPSLLARDAATARAAGTALGPDCRTPSCFRPDSS